VSGGSPRSHDSSDARASCNVSPAAITNFSDESRDSIRIAEMSYRNGWEHLQDELQRLRLRILLRLRAKRYRPQEGRLDGFQGLVISEQEIADLLRDMGPKDETDPDADVTMWTQSLAAMDASIAARKAASEREKLRLPLPHLCEIFRMSPFEEQCLVIMTAPELDVRYEKIYAFLQDDVTRKKPTVGLMLDLLCDTPEDAIAARPFFTQRAALLKYHCCRASEPATEASFLSRSLKMDERITEYLLGRRQLDPALDSSASLVFPASEPGPVVVDEDLLDRVFTVAEACCSVDSDRRGIVLHLVGARGAGKRALAEAVCGRAGFPLVVADLEKIASGSLPFDEAVTRLCRETLLLPAALCVEGIDVLAKDAEKNRHQLETFFDAIRAFSRLTFLLGCEPLTPKAFEKGPGFVAVKVPPPDVRTSARLWETYFAREAELAGDVNAADLATRFRLGTGTMHEAVIAARDLARWRAPHEPRVALGDITSACRALTTSRLSTLARKITPRQTWDDLVLPADQHAQLRELCNQARYRQIVQGDWGFERKLPLGKGLSALFSGPPGTGKTMAAQVIASEFQLDLYQIDLSQVVSKYIGETEKNLRRVFDEADASQAILFFDEADALFGKRSEVKDAHDRYANIEVGYLLQRMEEYEGVAILATNLRQNVDEAFVRRLRFIVEFPFPDEEHRRRIWEVTFPREAPLAEDVDLGILARELKLAGGNIKNIALAAAFGAAADGRVIRMEHLLQAARREHQKLGKSWTEPSRVISSTASTGRPS
jgi:DNA polymerase III delta prime subunit